MPDTDGRFPDDVPVADAIEQQRPTGESPSDDEEDATSRPVEDDVPLRATVSDWQEQRQPVLIDPVIASSSCAAQRFSASALSQGRGDLFQWPTQLRLHQLRTIAMMDTPHNHLSEVLRDRPAEQTHCRWQNFV
jgi:hypothetical protein